MLLSLNFSAVKTSWKWAKCVKFALERDLLSSFYKMKVRCFIEWTWLLLNLNYKSDNEHKCPTNNYTRTTTFSEDKQFRTRDMVARSSRSTIYISDYVLNPLFVFRIREYFQFGS